MLTIIKLQHDNIYRIMKIFYDKYDNYEDRIDNPSSRVLVQDWEAFVKSRSNNEF